MSNYTCQMEAMRFKLLEKKKGKSFFLMLLKFLLRRIVEVPFVCSPARGRRQAAEHDQRVEQRSRSSTGQNPTGRDRCCITVTGSCRVAALVQLITYSYLCYCSGGAFFVLSKLFFGYGPVDLKRFVANPHSYIWILFGLQTFSYRYVPVSCKSHRYLSEMVS